MPAKFLLVVIAGVITVLTILLIAGHGPWAGHEIIRISANHGVNDGDVPVIAAVAPRGCCAAGGCGGTCSRRRSCDRIGPVRENGDMSDATPPPSAPPSPLLHLPGAVGGNGIDAPVAAHYGSFNGEQRTLVGGDGFVDLSHRGVIRVSGPDRLAWLHSLTTQHLEWLQPGVPTATLVLSPNGHVEHAMYGTDDGEAFTAHVEPGEAAPLAAWLDRMRFMMRVEVEDLTDELAVAWRPVPRLGGWERAQQRSKPPGGPWQVRRLPSRRPREVRRGSRPRLRHLGLRGAPDRPRRATLRPGHRPPHHPQRGRLDPLGRAPRQGLLPRAGDRRARAHPRPAPAPPDPAAPRRLRQPAAHPGRPGAPRRDARSASSAARPATTSPARSRWPCSSATCPSTPSSRPTACPPARRSSSTRRSGCTCAPCADRLFGG